MRALQRMRQAIHEQRYRISTHANVEMSDDNLVADDVEDIILTGQIARRFTRDPRGTRYEVLGDSADRRRACVVCRFVEEGILLIITAYVPEV
ncbi:MAG: DUF4258 domain-containing protein [Chloroflexi bacterium]|nr:DUF4258 domain-containing protein [Chloroflexota bacterium]